jgi:hypothetical protein
MKKIRGTEDEIKKFVAELDREMGFPRMSVIGSPGFQAPPILLPTYSSIEKSSDGFEIYADLSIKTMAKMAISTGVSLLLVDDGKARRLDDEKEFAEAATDLDVRELADAKE